MCWHFSAAILQVIIVVYFSARGKVIVVISDKMTMLTSGLILGLEHAKLSKHFHKFCVLRIRK